jgi:hypothetical protein
MLRSVMLTYDDLGRVRVVSEDLRADESELVGDVFAVQAISGQPADPGRMTTGELATVGNV